MNKKDVLGLLSAAGNVQKMESMPHMCECWKCSFSGTQQGRERREVLARLCYLIQAKTKAKKF
jgi:hypothetical protein|nr:MAG TPA: hypothetical protein [Caudoviricetes sp.]